MVQCGDAHKAALMAFGRSPATFLGWTTMTERFVGRQNIEHYRRVLSDNPDEETRRIVQALLDEELAKRDARTNADPPDGSHGAGIKPT